MTARITEVEESYDRDGLSLAVTFGKQQTTIGQKLGGEIKELRDELAATGSSSGGGDIPDGAVTTAKLAAASAAITMTPATNANVIANCSNTYKGIVVISARLQFTAQFTDSALLCTIANSAYFPPFQIRAGLVRADAADNTDTIIINTDGTIVNGATQTIDTGYYDFCVTYPVI